MAEIFDFQKFRRQSTQEKASAGAPSEHQADSELVQIHRASARRDLDTLLGAIDSRVQELEKFGICVVAYRATLQAEQERIAQFHAFCPPSSSPYSPQMSQSMAMLSPEQAQIRTTMMTSLKALADLLGHALRTASEIARVKTTVSRLRRIVTPRNLRQPESDWDDPDMGMSDLITYAADPQGFLSHCDTMLHRATTALNEGRFADAYPCIGEAEQIVAYLSISGNAIARGGLVECDC